MFLTCFIISLFPDLRETQSMSRDRRPSQSFYRSDSLEIAITFFLVFPDLREVALVSQKGHRNVKCSETNSLT